MPTLAPARRPNPAPAADPVRVCFAIDDLSRAGTETQLLALIRTLDRSRVEPSLVLLGGKGICPGRSNRRTARSCGSGVNGLLPPGRDTPPATPVVLAGDIAGRASGVFPRLVVLHRSNGETLRRPAGGPRSQQPRLLADPQAPPPGPPRQPTGGRVADELRVAGGRPCSKPTGYRRSAWR